MVNMLLCIRNKQNGMKEDNMIEGKDINLYQVMQTYNEDHIENIAETVWTNCEKVNVTMHENQQIAIAVGSRGITDIVLIVKTIVKWIKSKGACPFIFPAMGSHGGSTALGQIKVLESLGITEYSIDAPIKATMEVKTLDSSGLENKVYIDRYASQADGIILINRVKSHTSFHAEHESGLIKLAVIGMGKQKQAEEIHSFGLYGLKSLMLPTYRTIAKQSNILMGVGIVENAYHQTARLEIVDSSKIEELDSELLIYSKENMARLPIEDIDLLIVDEMGKNISGLCMDTNIIGRLAIKGVKDFDSPRIRCIYVRDLTRESDGNAEGIGLADIVSRKLLERVDLQMTAENAITCGFLERCKVPVVAENDEQAMSYASRILHKDLKKLKIVHIKNTLVLDRMWMSQPCKEQLKKNEKVNVTQEVKPLLNIKKEIIEVM